MSTKPAFATVVVVLATVLPSTVSAANQPTARQRATAQCKAERKRLGSHPFHQKYGVHSDKGALRACINKRLRKSKSRSAQAPAHQ